jgi:hypothetical protein
MSASRNLKHFVVTWENGKVLVSRAREIVPYRTYEIIQRPQPYIECIWNLSPEKTLPCVNYKGIGLGERSKIKSCLS